MFYKEFILKLFSKMFTGYPSHRIERSKCLYLTFKVFRSLLPPPHSQCTTSQTTQRQLSKISYHSCLQDFTQAADSLSDILPNHQNPIQSSPAQISVLSKKKKKFQIPATLELISPHPIFLYYLVPLLEHLSVTKA